jgi:hypothetical protein
VFYSGAMKRNTCSAALVALLSLGAVASQEAASQSSERNRDKDHDKDRDRVCVYEHSAYGGWEQCYGVGESIKDLGNRRNQISSVRVYGRAEITLFEHPNFQGKEVVLGENLSNFRELKRWNDQVDSLRVESASFRGRPRPGQRAEERVCVYQHVGYRGNSQCFDAGEDVPDLKEIGWNDGISSIRTFGRGRLAVYEDSDFQGERLIVENDIPDLTALKGRGGWNWNDRISSLRQGGGNRGDRWRD